MHYIEEYTGFCHLLQHITLASMCDLHVAPAFTGLRIRGRTRTGIPAKSRQRQRAIQSFPKPVSAPSAPSAVGGAASAASGGQRFREVCQRQARQKHFPETCDRSGRSDRGERSDPHRVRSGEQRKAPAGLARSYSSPEVRTPRHTAVITSSR